MTVLLVPTVVNALRERVVAATVAIPTEDPLVALIAIATVAVAVVVQITTIPRPNATLVLMAKQVHLDLHHRHIVPRQKKVTVLLVLPVVIVCRVLVLVPLVVILVDVFTQDMWTSILMVVVRHVLIVQVAVYLQVIVHHVLLIIICLILIQNVMHVRHGI